MVEKLAVLRGLESVWSVIDNILAWQSDNYLAKVGGGQTWGGTSKVHLAGVPHACAKSCILWVSHIGP